MKLAERSNAYGMHFYRVQDKAGGYWILGINSKGIFQYVIDDLSRPKKVVFLWIFNFYKENASRKTVYR